MVVPTNISILLATYLMTVLSSSYGIIIDRAKSAPGHEKMLLVDSMQRTDVI